MTREAWYVPNFGRHLQLLRGARSLQQVAQGLQRLGFERASVSTLSRYEHGRVPDAIYLYALARLYNADIQDWLDRLTTEALGQPLLQPDPLPIPTLEEQVLLDRMRRLTPEQRQAVHQLLKTFTPALAHMAVSR